MAPFSGEYRDIGQSIMLSLQLALKEINDDNVTIYPRDSGFNDKQKFLSAVESLRQENVKIVIGPTNFNNFNYLNNYRDMIFISPSNTNPKVQDNVLSIGVSLESQIKAIEKFSKTYGTQPSEITILTYDALGLIYYIWNKNKYKVNSIKDFLIKDKIRGKIGVFSFLNGEFIQELEMYKASNKKFVKF